MVYQEIAQVLRHGKTDAGRLGAAKLLLDRLEFALRLERVLGRQTSRNLELTDSQGVPWHIRLTEEQRELLGDSVSETEAALRRELASGDAAMALPPGPVVDADFVASPDDPVDTTED